MNLRMSGMKLQNLRPKSIIKIRARRQHAQRDKCAKLAERRHKAETQEERDQIQEELDHHVAEIMADRATDDRLNAIAVKTCRGGSVMEVARLADQVLQLVLRGQDPR